MAMSDASVMTMIGASGWGRVALASASSNSWKQMTYKNDQSTEHTKMSDICMLKNTTLNQYMYANEFINWFPF